MEHALIGAAALAGVVRVTADGESTIDVIVGRHGWQRDLLHRARPTRIDDASLPVVEAADLVLLKLFAGGSERSYAAPLRTDSLMRWM